MKVPVLFAPLLAFSLFLPPGDLKAQSYEPAGGYVLFWDGARYQWYWVQYDPYAELHVMHYQLYLPSHRPYQVYPPCCYTVVLPPPHGSRTGTAVPRSSRPQPAAAAPLPRATSALPAAAPRR